MAGLDLASRVSTPRATSGPAGEPCSPRIFWRARPKRATTGGYDYGIKHNICGGCAGGLPRDGGPSLTSAEDVLALKPDGIFLSNVRATRNRSRRRWRTFAS